MSFIYPQMFLHSLYIVVFLVLCCSGSVLLRRLSLTFILVCLCLIIVGFFFLIPHLNSIIVYVHDIFSSSSM
ncbi:hypothetical protein V8C34DRAFT_284804 [Trichoderma compactum]